MIQIEFTADQRATLQHERFHYPDPRVQRKMEVVWLKCCDLPHTDIAKIAGVNPRTVQRVLNEFKAGGMERLKENHYAGQTSELNEHAGSLKEYFEKHPPNTVKEAQHVIEQQTGVRREETQVRAFLHRIGMKCRRMGVVPGKLTETQQEEQRRFLEKELNPRLNEAENGTRIVFFVDAVHFVHGAFLGMLWCFVRMFVRSPSGRKRLNVLGAIDYVTKQLVTVMNTTYITSTTVCELLKTLRAQFPNVPITLVLDNARYQKCILVQTMAAALNIELLYLPAYSPNLNLIERLWKHVKKKCLNGKYYATFAEFEAAITNCLQTLHAPNHHELDTLITRNFQLFDKQTFLAA
jgi:transposase